MPILKITTSIKAPIQEVFDASRNIDFHKQSMAESNEIAIEGTTSGLIEIGETVTWQATHFGLSQKLTVKITQMDTPHSFTDEMINGIFRSFKHTHTFIEKENHVLMTDIFEFESPWGILGKIANWCFLKSYMTKLLSERNAFLKRELEAKQY